MKVIFSYNTADPLSPTGPIRKHTRRGSAQINFLESGASLTPPEPIVDHLNFTMDNFPIPGAKESEYYCRIFKSPAVTKKLHAVLVSMRLILNFH